jgi:hypothetical protein
MTPESETLASQIATLITLVALFGFDLYCLREIFRAEEWEFRYFPRWTWAIICVVFTPLGGFAYLLYGRAR